MPTETGNENDVLSSTETNNLISITLIYFCETERNFDMQTRAMPLMGIALPPLFFPCPCGGEHHFGDKDTRLSLLEKIPSQWEVYIVTMSHRHCEFFSILHIFLCIHLVDLFCSLIASTQNALQIISSVIFCKAMSPPVSCPLYLKDNIDRKYLIKATHTCTKKMLHSSFSIFKQIMRFKQDFRFKQNICSSRHLA